MDIHEALDHLTTYVALNGTKPPAAPVLGPAIRSVHDAAKYVEPHYVNLDQEWFWVILLNTKVQAVGLVNVYRGTVDTITCRVAELLRPVIVANARGLIAVHNHPSCDTTPSNADMHFTRKLARASKTMDIFLHDHIIVGRRPEDGYFWMAQSSNNDIEFGGSSS